MFEPFYTSSSSDAILCITNFPVHQHNLIRDGMSVIDSLHWNTERVKRCTVNARDGLFMLLTVLKHSDLWNFPALMLTFETSLFQQMKRGFSLYHG